ncbi:MAG TPA: alpha-amylase family glycosyl hydrolase [Phycisphaerae bacterium]|nr:alpha-amylase family glycosyl hydrolase [Phycisphaerae bacterium]
MTTLKTAPWSARGLARGLGIVAVLVAARAGAVPVAAQNEWPPAPPLEPVIAAEDASALPASITAAPTAKPDEWCCTFRFRPVAAAQRASVVGSFNAWDRAVHPMQGPDANGDWTADVLLGTGVYEYKFLVDEDQWFADPANVDRVADGHGGFNSILRLGRLARTRVSAGKVADGKIDVIGLAHRPPAPLYVQPVDLEHVSLRYRTLAHDVQHVWLAVKGGELTEMKVACEGPLFSYWEARVPMPAGTSPRAPNVRSVEYTFVLDDGAGRVGDPHTYRYSFTEAGMFATPAWAPHAIWYQVLIDRFRNGNPANDPQPVRPWTSEWFTPSEWEGQDGQTFYKNFVFDRSYGGDLDGLAAQLPYLKELGVNALYLMPVFKAPSYHKYDVQNYVHIDDHFGTVGDYDAVAAKEDLLDPATWQWTESDKRFLAFLKQAHELGFKVILDGVFNHVGDQHPAFIDVRKNGKSSRFADWFDVTSWDPFDYTGWAGFTHMPVFRKSQNGFASDAVKQHIFNVTRRWLDPNGDGRPDDGIDGWRLDVPNDIPRPHWEEWRQFVKQINPQALITGEIWNRADQWLDGQHFDAVMNYEFARVAVAWVFNRAQKITASDAAARLAELRLAYPAVATYALQNLIDGHDTDRLASMALNPDREYDRQNRVQDNNPKYDNSKPPPEAYARARLVVLLQMTYVGAPMIYYGDEVGMWGADDPTNRKPMLWKDLEPYDQPQENAVMDEQLAFYRQAIALRHQHPALRSGTFRTLLTDDLADVWAFVRSGEGEHVLVVLNASDTPRAVRVTLPEDLPTAWAPAFGKPAATAVTGREITVQVPAIGGVALHAEAK